MMITPITGHAITPIKAAAAAAEVECDDSMVIAGDIYPNYSNGQEGKIRASALVIEGNIKICLVSCDVLILERGFLDDACKTIEARENIPFDNILIASTHTHHAPSTVRVHGYEGNVIFCERLKAAIVKAAHDANQKLQTNGPARCYFALGQECTVGQNSRVLLDDGAVLWVPLIKDFAFNRPTAPFDPQLPVLAFKRQNGELDALLFNHNTHNIGARGKIDASAGKKSGVQDIMAGKFRSPGFYGLAAQDLENELGGTAIFAAGAFGSTHDMALSTDEKIIRIKDAVKEAFAKAEPIEVSRIASVKTTLRFRVRKFDEQKEEQAVSSYCRKRWVGEPEGVIDVFRKMRMELAPHQGEQRNGWLHVMLIGDIAFVGVPGELFTKLGMEIKRRSPFRYTYIISLSNDYIGYIPDDRAFDQGGYQVWTGFHSLVERGTGEAIVEEAVRILNDLNNR